MDLLKMGQQLLGDKLGDNAGGMMEALSGVKTKKSQKIKSSLHLVSKSLPMSLIS